MRMYNYPYALTLTVQYWKVFLHLLTFIVITRRNVVAKRNIKNTQRLLTEF